ncbi:glycosyltransferase [Acidisoma cladoniae]|uniref:glycosyltransferase n=1 Tax=Acidisoma cladoniae TaxID=3040935 RepID=UPI00254CB5D8|nr:glycosyltransferase [Acidisoma sp. PAMC 29798]
MNAVKVVVASGITLPQDVLDHLGVQHGEAISIEMLPGARIVLAKATDVIAPQDRGDEAFRAFALAGGDPPWPSKPSSLRSDDVSSVNPKLKWYFCFNEAATAWFADMIKAAVTSARLNTDLAPHCIYDGGPSPMIDWLKDNAVTIHYTKVPFRARLFDQDVIDRNKGTGYSPVSASGYYLPLQIAEVETHDQYVLFTDCDIMFLKSVDYSNFKPEIIGAVAEVANLSAPTPSHVQDAFNSGVLVINVPELRRRTPELHQALEESGYYNFGNTGATYDQGLLNMVFKSIWTPLPTELNWRVFYGHNPDANIVHWHGPKPPHIDKFIRYIDGQPVANNPPIPPLFDSLMRYDQPSYRHYYQLHLGFLDEALAPRERAAVT